MFLSILAIVGQTKHGLANFLSWPNLSTKLGQIWIWNLVSPGGWRGEAGWGCPLFRTFCPLLLHFFPFLLSLGSSRGIVVAVQGHGPRNAGFGRFHLVCPVGRQELCATQCHAKSITMTDCGDNLQMSHRSRDTERAGGVGPQIRHNATSLVDAFSMISWQVARKPRSRLLPPVVVSTPEREGRHDQVLFRLSLWEHHGKLSRTVSLSSDACRWIHKTVWFTT